MADVASLDHTCETAQIHERPAVLLEDIYRVLEFRSAQDLIQSFSLGWVLESIFRGGFCSSELVGCNQIPIGLTDRTCSEGKQQ
jgi:hypothetical protein